MVSGKLEKRHKAAKKSHKSMEKVDNKCTKDARRVLKVRQKSSVSCRWHSKGY